MTDVLNRIDQAVALTKAEEYLRALTMFVEIYGGEEGQELRCLPS